MGVNVDELTAGPELDALVAERVMGLDPCKCDRKSPASWGYKTCSTCDRPRAQSYSTDIAAAWQVVEKLSERFMLSLDELHPKAKDGSERHGRWTARFMDTDPSRGGSWLSGECSTAPLAICRAALRAVGA